MVLLAKHGRYKTIDVIDVKLMKCNTFTIVIDRNWADFRCLFLENSSKCKHRALCTYSLSMGLSVPLNIYKTFALS